MYGYASLGALSLQSKTQTVRHERKMTSSGQSYSYPRRDPGPPGTDFELFEVRALSKGNMREAGSGGTQCQRMVAMEMGLSKKKAVGGCVIPCGAPVMVLNRLMVDAVDREDP